MKGEAPHMVEFRWVYQPPIPVGLDPAAREALVRQRFEDMLEEVFPDSVLERAPRRVAATHASASASCTTGTSTTGTSPAATGTSTTGTATTSTAATSTSDASTSGPRTIAGRGGSPTWDAASSNSELRAASTSDPGTSPAWDVEVLN